MGQPTLLVKCCTRCGIPKLLDEFYLVKGQRESRCKDCENARRRHRDHVRYTAVSDITPEQELAMRRKARKCPLCGVYMTGKPGHLKSKHLDHIVPLGVGGTHTHGNVRIICAACNLKRPKDGSDYKGPVTLWAQGEIQVGRVDRRHDRTATWTVCRKGLHPWTAENIKITTAGKKLCRLCYEAKRAAESLAKHPPRACQCGAKFAAPGSTLMCPDCTLVAIRTAAYLRLADGATWTEVAMQVGYGSGTGIRDAVVRRVGHLPEMDRPKAETGPERPCPECGKTRPKYAQWCEDCTARKAWQAVEMRRNGRTLADITGQVGLKSKTGVTNLMKTVVPIESKMGRPRKDDSLLSVT